MNPKPVALILAGYNKTDKKTKRKQIREIKKTYDDDIIYIGRNKFLQNLAGKPVIQYIIDAVYSAKKNNSRDERLYDKIYVYNDIKSISKSIDLSAYPNLIVKQMKDSVGGHLKDFCKKHISYGQRVDVFFGDTPRVTPEDVEWIHSEYNEILGKKRDQRGNFIYFIYSLAEFKDLTDNWLKHRLKYIKVGQNKGKLKHFIPFEKHQARVANSSAFLFDKSVDGLIEYEVTNFFYNLRKAITPRNFSKIIYYFFKTKHFNMVRQFKKRCIDEIELLGAAIDVVSKLYKIDLSNFGLQFYYIKKNASRWENDIDSPKDLRALDKKFSAMQKKSGK